ncbi:MAG TPA: hypothetical protein VJT78_03900 [Candidatus Dormibacteraeota bacterium]|nr:hypothetical protein [Candidatus Dormibacteraeota bacterium]
MQKLLVAVAIIGVACVALIWPPLGVWDISGEWQVARELLTSGVVQSYSNGARNAYPLPLELLFLPFGLLGPTEVAVLGRAVTLALIAAALWTWSPRFTVVLPALLSLPAVEAIFTNHVMSAVGLVGLSLAIWAQRKNRWFLCGVALGLGSIRLVNAVPVVVALLLCTRWSAASFVRMVLGALALLAPLTVLAFVVDPAWPREYQANLSVFGVAGVAQIAMRWGALGEAVLLAAISAIAVIAVRLRGKDGFAIAMALSVLGAPMQSPYTAIFGLPALVQVAARPGYQKAAWVVNDVIWLVFIATAVTQTVPLMSAVGLLFLVAAYPLMRASAIQPVREEPVLQGAST